MKIIFIMNIDDDFVEYLIEESKADQRDDPFEMVNDNALALNESDEVWHIPDDVKEEFTKIISDAYERLCTNNPALTVKETK